MKKLSEIGIIIFVLTIFVSAGLVVIISGIRANHTHYVCIEVNPRIEFLTNSKHEVKSFKPLNMEAKELIINEDFVGLDIKDATVKYLDLCAKSGYIKVDGSNNAVKLSVLSGITQVLELNLSQVINKFFVDNNILGVLIDSSQDLQAFKDAKKAKVDFEKYDLMMAVKEAYPESSLDELRKLNNRELIDKIEQSHVDYNGDYTLDELNNKIRLIESYKPIYDNHINSISNNSTRQFKEKLKEFRAKNTKSYKIDYEARYNEWLLG